MLDGSWLIAQGSWLMAKGGQGRLMAHGQGRPDPGDPRAGGPGPGPGACPWVPGAGPALAMSHEPPLAALGHEP